MVNIFVTIICFKHVKFSYYISIFIQTIFKNHQKNSIFVQIVLFLGTLKIYYIHE